eukprot:c15896_g1_i1.p1 GENE.c15896_g1_i1~~c15896_g1_i1.p1  ORF type:complete len:106 (+),score=22.99 c15896_g1_i1:133-450(+)
MEFLAHSSPISAVSFSIDGNWVATYSRTEQSLKLWRVNTVASFWTLVGFSQKYDYCYSLQSKFENLLKQFSFVDSELHVRLKWEEPYKIYVLNRATVLFVVDVNV